MRPFVGAALLLVSFHGLGLAYLHQHPLPLKAAIVAICATALVTSQLTFAMRWRGGTASFRWIAAVAASAASVAMVAVPHVVSSPAGLLPILLGLASLVFASDRMASLVALVTGHAAYGAVATVALFGLLAAGPVWLGPWIEISGVRGFADTVVAASPLTYLALLAEYDYLRSQWFYAHSPLGGLRYSYPGPLTASAGIVGAGLVSWLGERRAKMWRVKRGKKC